PARPDLKGKAPATWMNREQAAVAAGWRERLNGVSLDVPAPGRPLIAALRTSLAHVLITRDGPVLRPGTRSYARSWIRDGAMIAESLLRVGHAGVAADYLRWYAPHQFANGKVPCCVDERGADPVPEHDSAGELIFLAAEVYRYTNDRRLLEDMWPHVEAAARYLESLRQSERTEANLSGATRAFYGLLPASISHERYWREFVERRDGRAVWEDYTPYEIRTVGTFVRLGWRERAHELLEFFLAGRRPASWNQWPEVVGRDPRQPRFVGDLPHGWVA